MMENQTSGAVGAHWNHVLRGFPEHRPAYNGHILL